MVAEEKDVQGILSKLFEARSSKSYDSYGLVAKYVSPGSLANIILPLKKVCILVVTLAFFAFLNILLLILVVLI